MLKRLLSITLCLVMSLSIGMTAFATDMHGNSNELLVESRNIALNTPTFFGNNSEWEIVQETVLYDVNDEITAYCIDMKSNDTTAYTIVNADTNDFPVLLFGIDGISPYYGKGFEQAYYFGTQNYYVSNNGMFRDAHTNEVLTEEQILMFKTASNTATTFEAEEDYSEVRQNYILGVNQRSAPDTGSVTDSDVSPASLQWTEGCAPTAVAMLIKTKFSTLNATDLIKDLATEMGTDSNGSTGLKDVKNGTVSYFNNNSNLTAPATCKWNSTNWLGSVNTGIRSNPTSAFKSSIDSGFPVGVYCSSSNVTTSGYPDGIDAHMMSGVAYSFSSNGNYVSCYTTNTADGLVSFPLTSAGLKNHAWFLLKW